MTPGPVPPTEIIRRAAARAGDLENRNAERAAGTPEISATDVWSHTGTGLQRRDTVEQGLLDFTPAGAAVGLWRGLSALADGTPGASLDQVGDSMAARASEVASNFDKIGDAEGALQTVGATFAMLTSIEQLVTAPFAAVPFPSFPALRVLDMDIGLPHAHNHPPNLTPPNPVPVPLPSAGPVIPIPYVSGANTVLINGMPAARCGDLGLGIWCGGFVPMFEVFLGSASVWVEGARAGRTLCDITNHCIFSARKGPDDKPLGPFTGTTITGSSNVIIGGMPLPSLVNLAFGAALRAAFRGVGKLAGAVSRARALRELDEIANAVNPHGSTINCGNIIDAVLDRLRRRGSTAVAPAHGDGLFPQIEARFGTTLRWGSTFDDAFAAVRNGGDGTTAVVGIEYANGRSHVVLMTNRRGAVGIVEGQNWAPHQPAEVVTSPAQARGRYPASDVGYGIVP